MRRYIKSSLIVLALLSGWACEDQLDSPPFGEFAPENVLTNAKGIEAMLFNSYGFTNPQEGVHTLILPQETTTDIMIVSEGGVAGLNSPFATFTWTADTQWLNEWWSRLYRAIRDANIVIDNIDNFDSDAERREIVLAEARFIRASTYALLYNLYGPVVLRTSSSEPANKARATEEEMLEFIETELTAAAEALPHPGSTPSYYLYGRATKGTAMAHLAKHYLNTKQWQQAADMSKAVMDLGYYQLYPDFRELFFVNNEGKREMISVWPAINQQGYHTTWPNGIASPDFYSAPNIPELIRDPAQMAAWATNWRVTDWVVDDMVAADDRSTPAVDEYTDVTGSAQKYSDQRPDNRRYMKLFDPNAKGNFHGVDIPVIRYADILLTRAEALNELNQSMGEAKDLVIQVRERAGITDHTDVTAAAQGTAFRDLILSERAKEFIHEAKRREDLLRHDLFIPNAEARGVSVDGTHRRRFPIPAEEANNNELIVQDQGYN